MTKSFATSVAASAVALVLGAAPAFAQQAQYTSKDIIDTFAKKPAPQPAPPPPPGECEKKGMVTGDDGVCEPVKNARGFSLPTRATMAKGAPATAAAPAAAGVKPASHAVRTASITPRAAPAAAAAPTVRRDLLITFKLGSSELTDQAKANARVFAQALTSPALADAKFDISGYTDASGDKDKNLALSEARAASVKGFLVSQGVPDARLQAHGFGASDFAVSDPNSPKNRRVEAKRTE